MKMARPSRILAVFVMLWSLLFMQFAVAAYVCPGMATSSTTEVSITAGVAMPNCAGMDQDQPALCHSHAEDPFGKQSAHKPALPDVPAFVSASLLLILPAFDTLQAPVSTSPSPIALAHSTAPPLAIRNCCFRI
ncbi:hypothetical protein ACO0LG_07490 [Undibacterium sp. Ji42W]|uniref:hypothetical protein n=1 Tax=Undibacterium sp. Ji42W TaxID=3413039 RepID=UPI003BF4328E